MAATRSRTRKRQEPNADRMRLKLDILDVVLTQASARAERESDSSDMGRKVTLSDVARNALWKAASATGAEHAETIKLRSSQDGDRRRFPLMVPRIQYQAAKVVLRERGLSVAFVVEQALTDYARGETP